jgi:hypothetical protein
MLRLRHRYPDLHINACRAMISAASRLRWARQRRSALIRLMTCRGSSPKQGPVQAHGERDAPHSAVVRSARGMQSVGSGVRHAQFQPDVGDRGSRGDARASRADNRRYDSTRRAYSRTSRSGAESAAGIRSGEPGSPPAGGRAFRSIGTSNTVHGVRQGRPRRAADCRVARRACGGAARRGHGRQALRGRAGDRRFVTWQISRRIRRCRSSPAGRRNGVGAATTKFGC